MAGLPVSPDGQLIRLGGRFQELAVVVVDEAIANTWPGQGDYDWLMAETIELMCPVENQIIAWRANYTRGIFGKSQSRRLIELRNLNPDNVESLPQKVGRSLVRDIVATAQKIVA